MTTATIIQSQSTYGIRQTVVIHDPSPIVLTRVGSGKGISWRFDTPTDRNEVVVGKQANLPVTLVDREALAKGIPTELCRRLNRQVEGAPLTPTSITLGLALELLLDGQQVSVQPSIQPSAPAVVAPSQPEPAQVAPTQTSVEPAMALTVSALMYPSMTDPEVAGYIPPTINGKPAVEVLDFCVAEKANLLMWGQAGVGKTSLVTYYSALRNKPMAVLEGNIAVDDEMIQGGYHTVVDANGNQRFEWHDSAIVQAMRAGGVILFNEVNMMTESANAFLYRITQERKIQLTRHLGEMVEVHPDCLIVADGNRGYRGTKQLSQALNDRFGVQTTLRYDRAIERQFIPSDALLDCAFELRQQMDEGTMRSVFGTRVLKNFVLQAQRLGFEFALESMLTKMDESERPAIQMILEKDTSNICQELGIPAPAGY
jgi:ABC-type dipeptide/oligopeptide/nickel transport system ATPase component